MVRSTRVFLTAVAACALLASALPVSAADLQWSSYGSLPSDAPAFSLSIDPVNTGVVYAATLGSGLLKTDDGKSWHPVGAGTLPKRLWRVVVNASLGTSGSPPIYVASAGQGVFKSLDGGKSWQAISDGIDPGPGMNVRALATGRHELVIGTSNGVYRSSDGGKSWKPIGLQGFDISSVTYARYGAPTVVLAAIDGVKNPGARLLLTSDGGQTWVALKQGLPDNLVVAQVASGTVATGGLRPLFIAASAGVYKSDDGGQSWGQLSGLPAQVGFDSIALSAGDPNIVYVASDGGFGGLGGVWRSTDRGGTFTKLENGLDNKNVVALALGRAASGQPEPVDVVSWDPDKPAVTASSFNDTQARPADEPEHADCPEPSCQEGTVGPTPGGQAENPSAFPTSVPCPSPSPSIAPTGGASPSGSAGAQASPGASASPVPASANPTVICGASPPSRGRGSAARLDLPLVIAGGVLVLLLLLLAVRIYTVRRRDEP